MEIFAGYYTKFVQNKFRKSRRTSSWFKDPYDDSKILKIISFLYIKTYSEKFKSLKITRITKIIQHLFGKLNYAYGSFCYNNFMLTWIMCFALICSAQCLWHWNFLFLNHSVSPRFQRSISSSVIKLNINRKLCFSLNR